MNVWILLVFAAILSTCQISAMGVADRAVPHFCVNGTHCTDNECCLEYEGDFVVVGRSVVGSEYRGICNNLGHYNSDCPLKTENPIPSGKPEGLIVAKACPCQSVHTCTEAALEPGLGICL